MTDRENVNPGIGTNVPERLQSSHSAVGGTEHAEAWTPNDERNMGEQPIAKIILAQGLKPHDLVASSTEHLTHKMVARACKGRRLTPNVQGKVLRALNRATGKTYTLPDLFNY